MNTAKFLIQEAERIKNHPDSVLNPPRCPQHIVYHIDACTWKGRMRVAWKFFKNSLLMLRYGKVSIRIPRNE